MHFYEFEAKRLLAKHGIAIPESRSAETPAEVERAASTIGFPVVLKAQVLSRALARTSGVTPAASPAEARRAAEALLELDDGRRKPNGILVEKKVSGSKEYSLAPPCFGPRSAPMAPVMAEYMSEPVPATTRAVKVEALNSCSA